MNPFDKLLAEIQAQQELAKAMPTGDAKIEAAAAEGGADAGEQEQEEQEEADTGASVLGKAMDITLPDGTVAQAFEAGELVKALMTDVAALRDAGATAAGDLSKALRVGEALLGLVEAQGKKLAAQDEVLKALRADVDAVGRQPAGRRSVTAAPPAGDRREAGTPDAEELLNKALGLAEAGKFSALDVARAEAHHNAGMAIPMDLVAAIKRLAPA